MKKHPERSTTLKDSARRFDQIKKDYAGYAVDPATVRDGTSGFEFKAKCAYCEEEFDLNIKHKRKRFCSDVCRARAHREDTKTCWYCGEIESSSSDITTVSDHNACQQCAAEIEHLDGAPAEKLALLLHDKLVNSAKLNKYTKEWSDEELQDVSPNMRRYIREKFAQRMVAERRAFFMDKRHRRVW